MLKLKMSMSMLSAVISETRLARMGRFDMVPPETSWDISIFKYRVYRVTAHYVHTALRLWLAVEDCAGLV
jgi:hypothetical protein